MGAMLMIVHLVKQQIRKRLTICLSFLDITVVKPVHNLSVPKPVHSLSVPKPVHSLSVHSCVSTAEGSHQCGVGGSRPSAHHSHNVEGHPAVRDKVVASQCHDCRTDSVRQDCVMACPHVGDDATCKGWRSKLPSHQGAYVNCSFP